MKTFRTSLLIAAVLSSVLAIAGAAVTAAGVRYIHVKVSNPKDHELVRVNVPLSLAEKVIPAINEGELRDGKVRIADFTANNVNVRAILDALKTAPEGEFVSVQNTDSDVHVAKQNGQLVVHVIDKGDKENVDVTIPWDVAQALITDTTDNQLNVEAAVKALQSVGDMTLVRVSGGDESVRVWIDSRNTDTE
jgi:ribonuclease HI